MVRLDAREGLSAPFDVRVEVLTPSADLDLSAILWTPMAAELRPLLDGTEPRYFHGQVEAADYLGSDGWRHRYAFRLRPQAHGLLYRVRTRIFQDQTAQEIITTLLTDSGIPGDAVRWDTGGETPTRDYCTQWKESELAFVSRLLEDEGIFYWFEHTAVDHTMVLGDSNSNYAPIEGEPYLDTLHAGAMNREGLWDATFESQVTHDGYSMRDWNFESPEAPLNADVGEAPLRRRYEYPGGFERAADGDAKAATRLEELDHRREVFRATSNSLRLIPGRYFGVGMFPGLMAQDYVVIEQEHHFECEEADQASGSNDGDYTNRVTGIPVNVPFRPPRATPVPRAHGLESAVVTGPSGEEIHVDEYGRIKVHFYWDREQPVDDTASCWIRFQQINTQGGMILPRLGWEVHVAFLDGDPDRPVAFHKAYNQETMPPYALPANKTQSALQSSTSPGGAGTNEIRLQDGNGGMEWFMHASKDLAVNVANDENETVGIDATETVGNEYRATVNGDEGGTIGGNQVLSVSHDAGLETTVNKTVSVGGNDDWGLKTNFGISVGGDRTDDIGGLMNVLCNKSTETFNKTLTRTVGAVQVYASATEIAETVGGNKTETVSAAKAIITPTEHSEVISGSKTLTSGAVTIKAGNNVQYSAKGAVAITSAAVIDIKCGGEAMITGRQIRVTAGSATLKGAGGEFELGSTITIDAKKFGGKGGPELQLKGKIDYK